MNFKDRLVRKLLDFGKKNRLFVYPTLALVAVITAIDHAVKWGRSSGRKLVASILVLALLITQSIFIKSSAEIDDSYNNVGTATDAQYDDTDLEEYFTEETTDEESDNEESEDKESKDKEDKDSTDPSKVSEDEKDREKGEGDPDVDSMLVKYYMVTSDGNILVNTDNPVSASEDDVKIYVPTDGEKAGWCFDDSSYTAYFTISDLYSDSGCVDPIVDGKMARTEDDVYFVYMIPTRTAYPIVLCESDSAPGDPVGSIDYTYNVSGVPSPGKLFPEIIFTVGSASDYNAYKWGYQYAGLSYAGSAYSAGNIRIKTSSYDPVELNYVWSPVELDLVYDAASDADTHIDITGPEEKEVHCKYDDTITLYDVADMEGWASKEGYYLSGWTDGVNTYAPGASVAVADLVDKEASISSTPNVTCRKLTAIWTYKDINLNLASDNCSASTDDSGALIVGTYGEEISCVISANYKKDMSQGNKFSYSISQEDIFTLGKYGLQVTTSSDGERITSYKISGKLTDITGENAEAVNLTITDDNKPDDLKVSNHTIRIVINKRPVTIDKSTVKNATSDGKPSKAYDGSDTISVATSAGVTNVVSGDTVSAVFDSIAIMDNPNAGKGKAITLKSVSLVGTDAAKYVIDDYDADGSSVTLSDVAEVLKKPVALKISLKDGESDNILFGQETPVFVVDLVDPSELTLADQSKYNSAGSIEAKESFLGNYIGFSGYETLREIYSPAGTYTVKPIFSEDDCNYSVSTPGIKGTFVVGRETGAKDVNYVFDKEMVNGYYPGLTITPTGKYNKIRLLTAADSDISPSYTRSQAEALFSSSITIPDMTDGTISFQMLGTADGKGAITEIVTLNHINVDYNPPEYVGHSVSPNVNLFHQYDFGSYYHKQQYDGKEIESVTITVEYSSKDSECDKMYYFFADENGNPKGDLIRETGMTKTALGNFQGTLTVGTGVSGQIIVYASDKTGNVSVKKKIRMQDVLDYIVGGGDYYEWMVENTINSTVLMAVTKDGNEASTSSVWYNGISFVADAEDGDSGLNRIEWTITKPDGSVVNSTEVAGSNLSSIGSVTSYGKVLQYAFKYNIFDSGAQPGAYYAEATLYDNAGNVAQLNKVGPILVDCKPPVIDCEEPANDGYYSDVKFSFTVTEGEGESGISSVKVYKDTVDDNKLYKSYGAEGSYTLGIGASGKYIIVAEDIAGNRSERTVTFTGISDVYPEDPVITVTPGAGKIGNDGWYIEDNPNVNIKSKNTTSDGVPVTTYYKIISAKKEIEKSIDNENYDFVLNETGSVTIEAWSESASGCKSNTVSTKIKVDIEAPDAYISESATNDSGSMVINFKASDDISGVDTADVTVNGQPIQVEEVAGVVSGSFVVDENKTYSIVVKDKAGNVADPIEFIPLRMSAGPVTNIKPTEAYINANIYVGTYPLNESYIAYRKAGSGSYEACLANKYDTSYGVNMEYTFHDLIPDTEYEYRIYAMTKVSKEVKVIEGKFRTAKEGAEGRVYGKVVYGDDLNDTFKTYPIYVNLYSGDTIIAGAEILDDVANSYEFDNVADGSYRVVATNGLLTKESAVAIKNGGVSYPADYLSNNGINFVLTGLSTRVVISDGAICITADGLDKIYNTDLYNGNVTEADLEVVKNGGTIDIALYASYIDVSDVNSTTTAVLEDKLGADAEIKKYIQLYIIKTVRDADGNCVNNTPTNITRLAEKVTLAFPLGELSGQQIYVASLHGDNANYAFLNWNDSASIDISDSYVTISTDRFSVYALYKLNVKPRTFTVKWLDGDGNVMKKETVLEGESATPPTKTPTKSPTKKYYYKFTGWDVDYSNITKDTIVSARFSAHKKDEPTTEEPSTEDPTTDEPSTSEPTTEGTSTENPTTENPSKPDKPTTEANKPGKDKKEPKPSKSGNTYTYMGSAESPRTGDATPVVLLVVVMLGAAGALVVIGRKRKNLE